MSTEETETPQETTETQPEESPFQAPEQPEEQPEQPEEETEPERPPGQTPEALEKRARAVESSFKTYTRTVSRVYEEDAQYLTECPLCPDNHKGFVDVRFAGHVPQEIQDAVRMFFGIAREQDYAHSTRYRTCPECDGRGKVSTGSHVPEFATVGCEACQTRGYVGGDGSSVANGHAVTGPTVLGTDLPPAPADDDADEWGEPKILPDGRPNPNFGRMPNRKVLVEPWGVTANLNALSS